MVTGSGSNIDTVQRGTACSISVCSSNIGEVNERIRAERNSENNNEGLNQSKDQNMNGMVLETFLDKASNQTIENDFERKNNFNIPQRASSKKISFVDPITNKNGESESSTYSGMDCEEPEHVQSESETTLSIKANSIIRINATKNLSELQNNGLIDFCQAKQQNLERSDTSGMLGIPMFPEKRNLISNLPKDDLYKENNSCHTQKKYNQMEPDADNHAQNQHNIIDKQREGLHQFQDFKQNYYFINQNSGKEDSYLQSEIVQTHVNYMNDASCHFGNITIKYSERQTDSSDDECGTEEVVTIIYRKKGRSQNNLQIHSTR